MDWTRCVGTHVIYPSVLLHGFTNLAYFAWDYGLPDLSPALGCNTFLSAEGLDYSTFKIVDKFQEAGFLHTCLAFTIHLYQTEPPGAYPTAVCVRANPHTAHR